MYSKDNEPICGLCVNAKPAIGVETHCFCEVKKEYVTKSHKGCEGYRYDIFKRKIRRKTSRIAEEFSPEDFKL